MDAGAGCARRGHTDQKSIGDRSMSNASRFTQFSALAVGIAGALAFGSPCLGLPSCARTASEPRPWLRAPRSPTAMPSVVSNNPGAMGFIDQNTVRADVTVIDLTADFSGNATPTSPPARLARPRAAFRSAAATAVIRVPRPQCRRSPRCSRCMARSKLTLGASIARRSA